MRKNKKKKKNDKGIFGYCVVTKISASIFRYITKSWSGSRKGQPFPLQKRKQVFVFEKLFTLFPNLFAKTVFSTMKNNVWYYISKSYLSWSWNFGTRAHPYAPRARSQRPRRAGARASQLIPLDLLFKPRFSFRCRFGSRIFDLYFSWNNGS